MTAPLLEAVGARPSAASCPSCGLVLQERELAFLLGHSYHLTCRECCHRFPLEEAVITLSEESVRRATPEGALQAEWCHATEVPQWRERTLASGVHVHLGEWSASRDAMLTAFGGARSRARVEGTFYLWRLRLSPLASFAPGVEEDHDSDWKFERGVVTLYKNRWEGPGTVSAYAPAHLLEVLSVEERTSSSLWLEDSLYNLGVHP